MDGSVPSATALAAAIRRGELTAEAALTDCLERIVAHEDVLHAWVYLDPDRALEEARARDAEEARGPLHGVPVGIKDIIDTADQPTGYGSQIHAGNRPEQDAVVVARLRDAGAVVVGKTVTTEFAMFTPAATTNPHDPTRTPGGSSSGSAAAVAAGTVPLAIGTQTAGSVVRPASFCGIFGVKPTLGAVPTDGVKACSWSLDTVGAFGATVADVALALGVMAGDLERFRPTDLGDRPRVGFCRTHEWDRLEPATQAILEAAVEQIAGIVDVGEVTLPPEFAGLADAQAAIMDVEAAQALAPERAEHPDLLSEPLRRRLDAAADLADRYEAAQQLAGTCRAGLPEILGPFDVVLAPSVLGEAPAIDTTGDPLLCRAWTLLGTPTVAVPGLLGPTGLPLGVQVIADVDRDADALAGAALVAQLLGTAGSGHGRDGP